MYFPGSRIDLEEISNNTRIINGRYAGSGIAVVYNIF